MPVKTSKRKVMFEIDDFMVVLHYIRCIYPVEPEKSGMSYFFGFKFSDGFYECFNFKTKKEAENIHNSLVEAIKRYWEKKYDY